MDTDSTFSRTVRQDVEDSLMEPFVVRIRIASVRNLWPSHVFRCTLQSSSTTVPDTVIVRIPRTAGERLGSALLDKEHAALTYLTRIGSTLAPRFLAGGGNAGFIASEDLGTQPSLLDLLLGKDPEVAAQGTLAFARGLGRLHTQTRGGARDQVNLPLVSIPVLQHWQQVREAVEKLGLPRPQGIERDIAEIARILNEPGDYLALSSGDPSVVNCKIMNNGVRFFDFEEACFRHALIDAAVLRFLYPTGGPAWQLPKQVAGQIESAYRTEFARSCPEVWENPCYEKGMTAASGAWMITRMLRLPRVEAGPDRDSWSLLPPGWTGPIPVRSRRRQLVSILETWVDSANRAQIFGALAAWSEQIIDALRARWPEASEELPLYPAFRQDRIA